MVTILKVVAESTRFQNFIIGVILVAGILVGVQTYPSMEAAYGHSIHIADQIILWIFVGEALIKLGAKWPRPWRYFHDPWNVFDFIIVAICFLPVGGSAIAVLRLARLLRVMKLVRALPELRILVTALLKSVPSMFYISVLLFLLFYLYACLGTFMYQHNDPIHFKNLQTAFLSLYRVATLEDWTDIMYINMQGCANYGYGGNEALCTASNAGGWPAAFFFSSFTLIATMVILNLFIGVVMNGMNEAREEMKQELAGEAAAAVSDGFGNDVEAQVTAIMERLAGLVSQIQEIHTELEGLQERRR